MVKISIIVPIYGVATYIEKCAISLFEQTYDNIEYIFVDDCTPDNSINILNSVISRYPNRRAFITIVKHEQNKGLAGARNTGLHHATGDYVWFIDSDDWVEKNAIERCLPFLSQGKEAIWFNYYIEAADGTSVRIRKKPTIANMVSLLGTVCVWAVIYKKSLFFSNMIFPVEGINYSEDYVLNARLISVIKDDVCLHECLYHYNQLNVNSYSNNFNLKSLTQLTEGLILVDTFYSSNSRLEHYKKYMLPYYIDTYLKIYKVAPDSPILEKIELQIAKISSSLMCLVKKLRDNDKLSSRLRRIVYLYYKYIKVK